MTTLNETKIQDRINIVVELIHSFNSDLLSKSYTGNKEDVLDLKSGYIKELVQLERQRNSEVSFAQFKVIMYNKYTLSNITEDFLN